MSIVVQPGLFPDVPAIVNKTKKKRTQRVLSVLLLGGGVQSSTVVEMMIAGEIDRVDMIVFADTGDEPYKVYDHIFNYLKPKIELAGMEFATVQLSNIVDDLISVGRFIPIPFFVKMPDGTISQTKRQCTREYKISPANKLIKDRLFELGFAIKYQSTSRNGNNYLCTRVKPDFFVVTLLGISMDESGRAAKAKEPWRENRYPLIERGMTRRNCIEWLKDHGCRVPWKSSCKRCPYHNNEFWLMLERESPEEFAEVCAFDEWLRSPDGLKRFDGYEGLLYVHRSGRPLRERPFDMIEIGHSLFEVEVMTGSCMGDGGFSCST